MRKFGSILIAGLLASTVHAASDDGVCFKDDFEAHKSSLGTPQKGDRWFDPTNTSEGCYELKSGVGIDGSTALKITGGGGLCGVGSDGGMMPGRTVEFVFHVNVVNDGVPTTSSYNGPIQIALGFANGSAGTMARIGTVRANGDNKYSATDESITSVTSEKVAVSDVVVPFNTKPFDKLRAVLTLTSPGKNQIGGTYTVYVSADGGPEKQVGETLGLKTVDIPTDADETRPSFRIQRGGEAITATPLYDDIVITSKPTKDLKPSAMIKTDKALAGRMATRNELDRPN